MACLATDGGLRVATGAAIYHSRSGSHLWWCLSPPDSSDGHTRSADCSEATWQPIDNTPMHPEYPCAHCIISSAVATAMEADGNDATERPDRPVQPLRTSILPR